MRYSDWELLVEVTRAERDYCKWRAWKCTAGDDSDGWTAEASRLNSKLDLLYAMKREGGVQGT